MVLDEDVEVPGWVVVVAGRVVVTGVPSVDSVAVIIDPELLISVMLTLLAPSFHKLLLGEELPVKEGDSVKAGDVVLILEAMKMQNSITAPVSGVVKKISAAPGASVPKDSVLCIIEAK